MTPEKTPKPGTTPSGGETVVSLWRRVNTSKQSQLLIDPPSAHGSHSVTTGENGGAGSGVQPELRSLRVSRRLTARVVPELGLVALHERASECHICESTDLGLAGPNCHQPKGGETPAHDLDAGY
ncbi:MAG: hypothetical protein AAGD07_22345 [Planctomycetota bacterium]